MSLYFPGTRGLMIPRLTPEFRYDMGIAGGHGGFCVWVKPDDVNVQREIIAIAERRGDPFAAGAVLTVLRIEAETAANGTLTYINQSSLFGFCVVRRSVPGVLIAGTWQHVAAICGTSVVDAHIYVDGVEVSYAFTRNEIGFGFHGGNDVLIGSSFRGDGVTSPHYVSGVRLVHGDPTAGDPAKQFSTGPGTFFKGGMAHAGFWHDGIPASSTQTGGHHIRSLAQGFSPLFMNHKIEGSTFSYGLLMAPGLYGEGTDEQDPVSGITLVETVGSGSLSWIPGPPVVEPCPPEIEGPGPEVATFPRLCLPFGLPRAGIYDNPGNPADLLPIVYGDFRLGGLRGPVPATLIDQGEDSAGPWVYCAAFHAVMSIDGVYIDDVLQDVTSYTVSLSNNFQGRSAIATLTFETQPVGPVSWRGQGLYDSTGLALMENCIDQLVHLLTTWGNFDLEEDFDLAAHAESRAAVEALGYKTAFVVFDESVTQDWVTEMLFNVMGFWRVNGREQVEIRIDSGAAFTIADVSAVIIASRDCLDGDDGVEIVLDRQAIVNALTAYYLWSWSLNEASSVIVTERDGVSVNAYGEIRKAVTLKGLRRAVDVTTWATILFARQSARTRVEGATVRFTMLGARPAHLSVGDVIAFSWPYGPTREDDNPYLNEILRIIDIALDATRGGAYAVVALDLGAYLTDPGGARILLPVAA